MGNMRSILNRIANPVVGAILKTLLHRLLSRSVLLITVTGRTSGRHYTFPVQYVQRNAALYVVSPPTHSWARNLEGVDGARVVILLRGSRLAGKAVVARDATAEEAKAALAGTSLASTLNSEPNATIVQISDL
jgi:hypothetical protein